MKGQLSHTRVPERFMDHKYQELGRWERTLDQNLYMKGFIPFLIPYHLPTGSCLIFAGDTGKPLDSEIPGTKEGLSEDPE